MDTREQLKPAKERGHGGFDEKEKLTGRKS